MRYAAPTWCIGPTTRLRSRTVRERRWSARDSTPGISVTADYAFGHGLEKDTGNVVTNLGGRVVGNTKHPVGTADFASLLLTAQASKAKVVALANAGGDTINSIKQAAEFGLTAGGQKLAALAGFINDVHGLGLKEAQGLTITEASYWDMNDETRKWA